MLCDRRPKRLTGDVAEKSLDRAGITCNKNGIPFDPEKPTVTSGIRLGTPAATTRGFGSGEFKQVGTFIGRVLGGLEGHPDSNAKNEQEVREEVRALCRRFPIYPDLGISARRCNSRGRPVAAAAAVDDAGGHRACRLSVTGQH